ncbi:MAG TPA: hypothetical protein VL854_10485 [Nitrososphaeraceae archaeon]|nr:hypothetical protein [Nitrososphaeraceae archaeon]
MTNDVYNYRESNRYVNNLFRISVQQDQVIVQIANHTLKNDQYDSALMKVPIKEFKNIIYKLGI